MIAIIRTVTRDEAPAFETCWKSGDHRRWCKDAFAHFIWPEEIVALFREADVGMLDRAGLEGISSADGEEVKRVAGKYPERRWVWLAALFNFPAVFAGNQHRVLVARNPPR